MNPDWKGRSKTVTVIADNMILYIENPKDATRKLLEIMNEFSKVAGYKINTQKPVAFQHTNSELSKINLKQSHLQLHQKE